MNLDDTNRALGRIEGGLGELKDQVTAILDKQQKINEEVIEQRGAIKVLAAQQAELKPKVDQLENLRNQGKGALWGITFASGSMGAGIATLIARLWNNGSPPIPPAIHGG